jgi:pilus assembly protein Flp/PilA
MIKLLTRLSKDEEGAAMVEYSVLVGIITVGVIALVVRVGAWVTAEWTTLCTTLSTTATKC